MKKFFHSFLFLVSLSSTAQIKYFYGPFKSWTNLKEVYGAKGNGIDDDTRAIQQALDELGEKGHSPVLYIPSGTYKISATLTMATRWGIAITGEDPLTTIIKWDGPANAKMFSLNGVTYSEYSRLTWDGSNTSFAAVVHEWDGKVRYANSGTEHSDEIFINVGTGLNSGKNMDAEFTIRRCRFINCSKTGISLQGFNALDWFVWDCYFDKCYAGISNNLPAFGAGNFHVYRSVFKNSLFADISIGSANYFSFRENIFYHSKKIISARQFSNSSPITFQKNIIISKESAPITDLYSKGHVLFLDNTFITPDMDSSYIIEMKNGFNNSPPDLTLIGNRFNKKKNQVETNAKRFINQRTPIVKAQIKYDLSPKPFLPKYSKKIIEVTPLMKGLAMRNLVSSVVKKEKNPVIHFSYGDYAIDTTIDLPAGKNIVIIGDALSTRLTWKGRDGSSLLKIEPDAEVTISNLRLNLRSKADGILINAKDKAGDLIYTNQLIIHGGTINNLLINGFSNTRFRFESLQHSYSTKGTSIAFSGTNATNSSPFQLTGGVSLANKNTYALYKKAKMVVTDIWYESSEQPGFLQLDGEGDFTLSGAKIAPIKAIDSSFISIDNFKGNVSITQAILNVSRKKLTFNNDGKGKLLLMGILTWSDSTNNFLDIHSSPDNFGYTSNRYNTGMGSYPLKDTGNTSAEFLETMLKPLRSLSLTPATPVANRLHVTLNRVMMESGIHNLRIEKQ